MTNEEKIQYWVNLAEGDLEVAEAMLRGRYYLYVAFMCHQVVEKIFKGYYAKLTNETPPYTHDLRILAKKAGFWEWMAEEQKQFVRILGPLNIRTRYPDYKNELAKTLTYEKCIEIIEQTKKLYQWTRGKLL
jgi:HEPN domain-containing protein